MNIVGARLQPHGNNRARLPSVLRFRVDLGIELLDGVDRNHRHRISHQARGIDDAQGGEGFVVGHTVHNVGIGFRANAVCALVPSPTARVDHDAGAQGKKLLVIPAIQGQVIDGLVADGATKRGAGAVHQWNLVHYYDHFGNATRRENKVDTDVIAHLQLNVRALDRLESLGFDADLVHAWKEVGSEILAGVIRDQVPRDPSLEIGDGDGSANDGASRLISNRT